jgi:hypothetical protein
MKIRIVSIPRSGSSYLSSVLTNTLFSDHKYLNEPFMSVADEDLETVKEEWTDKIAEIAASEDIIVKVHMHHLEQMEKLELLEDFKSIEFDKTFFISRDDIAEAALSLTLSGITGSWYEDTHEETSVEIDEERLIGNFNFIKFHTDNMKKNVYDIEADKVISYEDLTFDRLEDIVLLGFEFDGELSHTLRPDKFRHKALLVSNYVELKDMVATLLNDQND